MPNMSFRYLVFALLISFNAQAGDLRPGVEGSRIATNALNWIGQLKGSGTIFCTAWIIKHGIAVTAKHCFSHQGLDVALANQYMTILSMDFTDQNNSVITVRPGSIIFDEGNNDIAFLIYDKSLTETKITFEHELSLLPIGENSEVSIAGFPHPTFQKVISQKCRTTGVQKGFPPMEKDPGYIGIFEDTTCAGWFGVSGGPVFLFDPTKNKTTLYGVVTHTFDVLANGEPDPQFFRVDQFGDHSTTMYSPLASSQNLLSLLNGQ